MPGSSVMHEMQSGECMSLVIRIEISYRENNPARTIE